MDKIICLGKNYLDHAKELGDTVPEKPVIFLKPPSVLLVATMGSTLSVPLHQTESSVHHECELVVRLKSGGSCFNTKQATEAIEAVTVGLDMTLRDLQTKLKKAGHPWTTAKVFPGSAIVGPFIGIQEFKNFETTPFSFTLNGIVQQSATAKEMLLPIVDSICYVSQFFPLQKGDLLFTGTPKGVGPVQVGAKAALSFGPIQYGVEWK